jgi:hypothetical protein
MVKIAGSDKDKSLFNKNMKIKIKIKIITLINQNQRNFTVTITSIFFIFCLIGILNHAMWRDELNVWLITRDSESIAELFYNINYEGHPPLWYFCLSFLNLFTNNPVIMQIFHLFLATGSIYLFINFSPFTKLQKILFTFGYLPFYEYVLISRNYALGLLFLIAFCSLYETRKKTYLWLSLILGLMANSNAYSLFISFALALTLLVEYLAGNKINPDLKIKASKGNFISGSLIYVTGLIISCYFLIPPQDSMLQGGLSQWFFKIDLIHLGKSLGRIWNSYISIILFSDGSNIESIIFGLVSLGFILLFAIFLRKKPLILLFYLTATLLIILFTYLKFLGSPRHYGHLYLILIASFWLESYYQESIFLEFTQSKLIQKLSKVIHQKIKLIFTIILIFQLLSGIVSFTRDLFVPYSAGKATVNYLKQENLDQTYLVGSEDFTMATISGYLNRKIYYPESQKMGSFVLFNQQRQVVDDQEILKQVSQLLTNQNLKELLLILNHEITTNNDQLTINFLEKFTHSLIFNEKYYLYKINL